jgi:hypothetical protein
MKRRTAGSAEVPLTLEIPWQPIKSHVEIRVCRPDSQAERIWRTARPSGMEAKMGLRASSFTVYAVAQE